MYQAFTIVEQVIMNRKTPDLSDSHPLAKEVLALKNKGFSLKYIANHCVSEGYKFTQSQIKKYILSKEQTENCLEETIVEQKRDKKKPVVVGLEKFSERFNIPDNLSNPDEIMGTLQRLSAHTIVLQFGILIEKLEAYQREEIDRYPYEQVRGLKLLNDVFCQLWGYEQAVNLSTAMKTLENQGYKIDAVNILEEKPSNSLLEGDSEV